MRLDKSIAVVRCFMSALGVCNRVYCLQEQPARLGASNELRFIKYKLKAGIYAVLGDVTTVHHRCMWCNSSLEGFWLTLTCDGIRSILAGNTTQVDHVADGSIPGSTVLSDLTRGFHIVLSPSCLAEDSRSGEGLQACLDRGCLGLQLASSCPAPRARWCESLISSSSGCLAA